MTIKQKNTTITIDVVKNEMITSRLLNNKVYRINMSLDGTIGDLGTKVTRVSSLDNENYVEFARIQLSNNI